MTRLIKIITLFLAYSLCEATPAQVLIIRHAEKLVEGIELDLRGRERAAAFAPFFMGNPEVLKFEAPAAIYACYPNAEAPSIRCIQTVTPLSKELSLNIIKDFNHSQYAEMAHSILTNPSYNGKSVLICWEHHAIPLLAKQLGATEAPDKWKGTVFDRVWILTYSEVEKVGFQDIPQKLLYNDASH